MTPFETIETSEMVVACNGGGGPLGHPRVYLNLAPAGRVECPYCSRLFVNRVVAQAGGAAEEAGGPRNGPPHGPRGPAVRGPAPRQLGDVAAGGENG